MLHRAGNVEGESLPRVHALNVIRMTFSNTALAKDVSEFLQQGMWPCLLADQGSAAWWGREACCVAELGPALANTNTSQQTTTCLSSASQGALH